MEDEIIIVSGLPRSGTSMMMQMLAAGGLTAFADNQRGPDNDNPAGYFESQKVKDLTWDNSWVKQVKNKALKVVSPLLEYLPDNLNYKVIFMERNLDEILASQNKMMARRGEKNKVSDKKIKKEFLDHLRTIKPWLENKTNFQVLYVLYSEAVEHPEKAAEEITNFLNKKLDIVKMVKAVKPEFYRNRFCKF